MVNVLVLSNIGETEIRETDSFVTLPDKYHPPLSITLHVDKRRVKNDKMETEGKKSAPHPLLQKSQFMSQSKTITGHSSIN